MKTTININISKTEIDKMFTDLAKKIADSTLQSNEGYSCHINVDANSKEFSSVDITFVKNIP